MPAPKELDPSASLAALYGAKLRKLRLRAGLTQRQLGAEVPIAHSRIAQFELGNEVPPEDVDAKLDKILGADGDLTDLWGHIHRTPFPDWASKFMEYESKAVGMHKYVAASVPGLLQTPAYAREVLHRGQPWCTSGEIETKVTARMKRQSLLRKQQPPLLWVVLDEAVIRRSVGGGAVMREQLAVVVEAARAPFIEIQVLPFSAGGHSAMGGSLNPFSSCPVGVKDLVNWGGDVAEPPVVGGVDSTRHCRQPGGSVGSVSCHARCPVRARRACLLAHLRSKA